MSFHTTFTATEKQHSFHPVNKRMYFSSFFLSPNQKTLHQDHTVSSQSKLITLKYSFVQLLIRQITNMSLTLNTGKFYTERTTEIKQNTKNTGNLPIGKIAFLQTPLAALRAPEATEWAWTACQQVSKGRLRFYVCRTESNTTRIWILSVLIVWTD